MMKLSKFITIVLLLTISLSACSYSQDSAKQSQLHSDSEVKKTKRPQTPHPPFPYKTEEI